MNRSMCVFARACVLSVLLSMITLGAYGVAPNTTNLPNGTSTFLADGEDPNGDGGGGYTGG